MKSIRNAYGGLRSSLRARRQIRGITTLDEANRAVRRSVVQSRRVVEEELGIFVPSNGRRILIPTSARVIHLLKNVEVYAHYGLVVTQQGALIEDSVTKRGTLEKWIRNGNLAKTFRVDRVDVPLYCLKDHPNVYHFWRETVAPLALLHEPEVAGLPQLLVTVTTDLDAWRRQVIERALPPNALLQKVSKDLLLSAPVVVLPSRYRSVVFPESLVVRLREWASVLASQAEPRADGPAPAPEGVYISRRATRWRRPLNEPTLISALDRSFAVVQPESMSTEARADTFSSARLVVAQSGAGLTNLLHARPETQVLELRPSPTYGEYFTGLSASLGLRHTVLDVGVADPSADMHLPVPEILKWISERM